MSERTHGMWNSPEYAIYMAAKQRCVNPNNPAYSDYGARGIRFLFSNFIEFYNELGPRRSVLHSIDRINNNGNYEKGNVRWATRSEQRRNRRDFIENPIQCKRGHALTKDNVYYFPSGIGRSCRECHRLQSINYRKRKVA